MFKKLKIILSVLIVSCSVVAVYHSIKPLPDGVSVERGPFHLSAEQVQFLGDRTFQSSSGARVLEQEIFNEVFSLIDQAESFILLDMFLLNEFQGRITEESRPLSTELVELLIKQAGRPDLEVILITDPINNFYSGLDSELLALLDQSEVELIITDLKSLRDPNPLYSGVWRLALQWWPSWGQGRWPNLLDHQGQPVRLSGYLELFNFKANHRKVVVADSSNGQTRGLSSIITSANPHTASSAHSNIAFRIDSLEFALAVIESEQAVAEMSGRPFELPPQFSEPKGGSEPDQINGLTATLVTEGRIKSAALKLIENASAGSWLDLKMFYLSDRDVVKALVEAVERGVSVRLLLDPNKDAFGREKDGVPNRPVAQALKDRTDGAIDIRWCHTLGEQCHSKMLIADDGHTVSVLAGSANFTRRNIADFNLETNILIEGSAETPAIAKAMAFFVEQWRNHDDRIYSLPFSSYQKDSRLIRWRSWLMEVSGLSTF